MLCLSSVWSRFFYFLPIYILPCLSLAPLHIWSRNVKPLVTLSYHHRCTYLKVSSIEVRLTSEYLALLPLNTRFYMQTQSFSIMEFIRLGFHYLERDKGDYPRLSFLLQVTMKIVGGLNAFCSTCCQIDEPIWRMGYANCTFKNTS